MGTITHSKLTHAPADSTALIDGPAWDATHTFSLSASDINGLAPSATTDTTQANNITSGTLNAARLPALSNSTVPLVNGTASAGVSTLLSRQDHVHPTDTSRASTASPTITGAPIFNLTSGQGFRLIGNGSTTPSKYVRANAGDFQVVNDANNSVILDLTDAGLLTVGASPNNGDSSTKVATTAWVQNNSSFVASGTTMLFLQAAAPTGWTRVATFDDALLRIVGSATPSSGGSNGFVATFNAQTATSGFTLTTTQLPTRTANAVFSSFNTGTSTGIAPPSGGPSTILNATPTMVGGGAAHTHGITTNINYVDSMICRKN